ncbi:HAD family hydrolase [Sagittula sp. MA-2]|uniref:D-glycero-alpha-D-manno-heptose-1,7-bisphosphate 7-phosphatase n=1 Tax=Sagittula sp. MA-2 TaxID=3048007 RepID=UPI0024C3B1AB|nr:HAD family hydrolase [Sagittula sp. MA-2]WHZ37724.1 HAD family hydrolase [Sagittula sp. MA-2]
MNVKVAYLDRDGTINVDPGYLSDPRDFRFCEGAIEGLRCLQMLGLDLVVITNQSGVSRGYFEIETLEAINARMCALLAEEGVTLAGIYYCPHGPEDGCDCRKPKPGMIMKAEERLGRRPGVMIGDSVCDIEAGNARDLMTIRIADCDAIDASDGGPNHIVTSLAEAASWLAKKMKVGQLFQ